MTLANLNKEHFTSRIEKSNLKTDLIAAICKKNGHFKTLRKATKDEDVDGVDYWVTFSDSDSEVPIQFKLRPKPKHKDVPINRYQPFYGHNHEKTKDGRDFRGIRDEKTVWYYVVLFDEVYRVPCEIIRPELMALCDAWDTCVTDKPTLAPSFFTPELVQLWSTSSDWQYRNKMVFSNDNGQVWFKKSGREAAKFNMYLPYALKEWSAKFTTTELNLIKKLEDKLKNQ